MYVVPKEKEIQENLIAKLETLGWTRKTIKNESDLLKNFKQILETRNKEKLNSQGVTKLSQDEFKRFISKFQSKNTFSDFATFLLDDDNHLKLDNGKSVHLNIFDKQKWCKNTFEVTDEFTSNNQRHDVILLINGLPIANIELKRPTVDPTKALNQTRRYSQNMGKMTKFIQLFIISNSLNTYYYAATDRPEGVNTKYVFKYMNVDNKVIDKLQDFADNFLKTCTFSKYIARYMINKTESKELLALRGYQVHACEKALYQLQNTPNNGYIWHATGSGKTITSFKVAQIIAQDLPHFDKVIFLVDRKDLDTQTTREYNSFLKSHEQIDKADSAYNLFRQLKSANNLIIATIQKMDRLIQSDRDDYKAVMKKLSDKNIVFIIDECHRSQFGDMHARIKKHFKKARYIGFTGTPIFKGEDQDEKLLTTNEVFGSCIHNYLIKNALEDKNVLPFNVEYWQVGNVKKQDKNSVLTSDSYIEEVVKEILQNHDKKTLNRRFSSILTVPYKKTLLAFYKELKRQQAELVKVNPDFKPLNISATFSHAQDESNESYQNKDALEEIINDFNKITKSNESASDVNGIQKFQTRLQSVLTKKTKPELDLVIVVDQLLTGFDAKRINTLYVAKDIKGHNLIQAFSRTNRVLDEEKNVGNIICFVPDIKAEVDKAIKRYSNSDNANAFLTRNYDQLLEQAKKAHNSIMSINVKQIIDKPGENVSSARELAQHTNRLYEVYRIMRFMKDYKDTDIASDFNLDKMRDFKSQIDNVNLAFKVQEPLDKKTNKPINPYDQIRLPLSLDIKEIIDERYIARWLQQTQSQIEQGQREESKKTFSKMVNHMQNEQHVLYDIAKGILDNFNQVNDIKKSFFETILQVVNDFKAEYKISDEQIKHQIKQFELKKEFDDNQLEQFISNKHPNFEDLPFLERTKIKNDALKDIEYKLKTFIEYKRNY